MNDKDQLYMDMTISLRKEGVLDNTVWNTFNAAWHVAEKNVPGDVIECGVYKGRQIEMLLRTFMALDARRDVYLYDTFRGMSEPGKFDAHVNNPNPSACHARWADAQKKVRNEWCYASLDEVKTRVLNLGYPTELIHFVEGDVCKTLTPQSHELVSLARLDTDFYESIAHGIACLWPVIADGGVLLIDDYAKFLGAKKAVDEFAATVTIPCEKYPSSDCAFYK